MLLENLKKELNETKIEKRSAWEKMNWPGPIIKVWKDEEDGVLDKEVLAKVKYFYHGTTLKNAEKLLKTGIKVADVVLEGGFQVSADISYAKTYVSHTDEKELAIIAIPKSAINFKKVEPADNWDDLCNISILHKIPADKLKIIAIAK